MSYNKEYNNEFNNLQINNSDVLPVDTWLNEQYEFKSEEEGYSNQLVIEINEEVEKSNQIYTDNPKELENLLKENKELKQYNKELVAFNNKILNKLNSLDNIIVFLNKVLNADKSEEELKSNNKLLLELIKIIDSNDEGKLLSFINRNDGNVGIEVIVSYLKMKLGLTL